MSTIERMPDANELTDLQLMILTELWARGQATVGDLHDALAPRTGIARKTIATLLGRLEQRGFVRHRTPDRENVYRATVGRRRVLVDRMAGVLGALFPGEAGARAVSRRDVREGDVERLLALLRRAGRDVRDLDAKDTDA